MGVLSMRGVWVGMIEGVSEGLACEFIGSGRVYKMRRVYATKALLYLSGK